MSVMMKEIVIKENKGEFVEFRTEEEFSKYFPPVEYGKYRPQPMMFPGKFPVLALIGEIQCSSNGHDWYEIHYWYENEYEINESKV